MIKSPKNGIISVNIKLNKQGRNDLVIKAWNEGTLGNNTLKVDFFEGIYKKQKSAKSLILHSKRGQAAGLNLNCNGK
ncbi:MAG: hypothetical protein M0D57_08460 [Sphingobacteriales bacterium JAD_PAG50586_3]|nr:MAG: hypothetical protein M0D57_08460 [Sphingobacteriales bacterium JAD_PAG50586_3]